MLKEEQKELEKQEELEKKKLEEFDKVNSLTFQEEEKEEKLKLNAYWLVCYQNIFIFSYFGSNYYFNNLAIISSNCRS